ncbi:tRNA 4-thiouridine(8) synthase ThiI [Candidatus Nanohaloarchaea archaeon]|nr:tRNA 4-thiouridine(8) synthase ThiI [Candidatus Nanohaloarchaea archaeon]
MNDKTGHVLIRYGEIGTKSRPVQGKMLNALRQRVQDKLEYEEIDFQKVSLGNGRIIVKTDNAEKAVEKMKNLPGVVSASPALKVNSEIEEMKEASENFEYGETFGIDATTSNTELSTLDINRELGGHVEEFTGSPVDLDNPETWLKVEVRGDDSFLFTTTVSGPGGLPVGTQDEYLSLISGGIDSPVATYKMMKSGADITPIYFYNRPIAAEDHLIRFEAVLQKLKEYHPGKKWNYYIVDMDEVNKELMGIEKGRMVVHRKIMFKVAEKIAEKEGLRGLVTGESLGQKSSQTARNLENTTREIEKPLMRPLLTESKNEITAKAREIGTFELSEINSACRSLAPDSPSTDLKEDQLQELEEKVDIEELVEKAFTEREKKSI